jgi:hypothetical protein
MPYSLLDISSAFFLFYSLTLQIEAASSFKTSLDFPWNTWHYIPED